MEPAIFFGKAIGILIALVIVTVVTVVTYAAIRYRREVRKM